MCYPTELTSIPHINKFISGENMVYTVSSGINSVFIADIEFDNISNEIAIPFQFAVFDSKTQRQVYHYRYSVGLRSQQKKISLRWNPLSFPKRIQPDHEQYYVTLQVQYEQNILLDTTFSLVIKGVSAILQEIEKKNQPVSKEYLHKLLTDDVIYSAMHGCANVTGWTSSKWDLYDRKLAGCEVVDVRQWWYLLEPEPEKFDWELLDNHVQWAEELGIPIIISIVWSEGMKPLWITGNDYMAQPNISITHPHNLLSYAPGFSIPSYASDSFRLAVLNLTRKVVERYRSRDIILGWNISFCNNDNLYTEVPVWDVDAWVHGDTSKPLYLLDYSSHARNAFQQYLKQRYPLTEINRRYGNYYNNYPEIDLPQPQWTHRLDRRPIWFDFQLFKVDLISKLREQQFQVIRALDSTRWIYGFGLRPGILDTYLIPFKKYHAIFNASIYGPFTNEVYGHICRKNGVRCLTEDYWIPPAVTREVFDAEMLQNFRSGVIGHIGLRPVSTQGIYTGDFARWRPVFHELARAKPISKSIGILGSFATQLAREKTFYTSYYFRGNELINNGVNFIDTINDSGFSFEWFSDYSDLTELPYKLIIDLDSEILPESTMNRLVHYVQAGGHLLVFADSGRYTPTSESDASLLKKLGFMYPLKEQGTTQRIQTVQKGWERIIGLPIHFPIELPKKISKQYTVYAYRQDGTPGIIGWRLGKGSVYFISGVVDWKSNDQNGYCSWLLDIIAHYAGCHRDVKLHGGTNIRSVLLQKDSVYYLICYNETTQNQHVTVQVNLPPANNYMVTDCYNDTVIYPHITGKELTQTGISVVLESKRAMVWRIAAKSTGTKRINYYD
ncbi:MAG: beta-galactosidase [bacterium]|nr:beta-galactosidase [bacterium]